MNSTAAVFATTHWSAVLAAGQSADAQASRSVLKQKGEKVTAKLDRLLQFH